MTFEYDWHLDVVIDPKTMQVTTLRSLFPQACIVEEIFRAFTL